MSARRRIGSWIVAGLAGSLLAWACGGPQELGGAGDVCYRDDDCQAGLVCIAATGEDRRCTSDVTGLIRMVPGAPAPMPDSGGQEGGAPGTGTGGAPGAAGAPNPPAGGSTGVPDAGTPDTAGAGGA